MTSFHSHNFSLSNRLLRRSVSVCAVLIACVMINTAVGQTPRPQDRIVSPAYLSPPRQPQAAIPRMRPVPSRIVQASAEQVSVEQVTVAEPQMTLKEVPVTLPLSQTVTAEAAETDVAEAEGSLGPGPDFASQLPEDDSHLIQFIEVMQWTVLVLLVAVVAVVGLKKYGRGNLITPQNSSISLLATLPVKNVFQAHLLQIGSQQFLVTTDRSGVKTVNPINAWDDLDIPVTETQEVHDTAIAA